VAAETIPAVRWGSCTSWQSAVALTYYTGGRLQSTAAGVAATSYEYDLLGRVSKLTQNVNGNIFIFKDYTYNLASQLKSVRYPSDRVMKFDLDQAGRVNAVSGKSFNASVYNTYADSIAYAPHGAITGMVLGNKIAEKTEFNSSLQPYHRVYGHGTQQNMLNMYWLYCSGVSIPGDISAGFSGANPVCVNGNVMQHVFKSQQQSATDADV